MSSGASKDYNKKKDAIWAHDVSFCDGNTGVATCTANTPYSIGYSVLGDELDANLDIAVMGVTEGHCNFTRHNSNFSDGVRYLSVNEIVNVRIFT